MSSPVSLEDLLANKKISQKTYEKVQIAKNYIEKKYNMKIVKALEYNVIFEKINSLNIPDEQKEQIKTEISQKETARHRKLREKITIYDYESLSIIGRGAFGEVHICRDKKTNQIVAIKKIKKEVISQKNQLKHIRDEQTFMSKVHSPWIVELKASFQEGDYLFLVMDYLPGGDFMNLLIDKDIFNEQEAKFYLAEIVLAVESLHKLDCIHRDIKPDNILLDYNGHIKFCDFGLAKLPQNFLEIPIPNKQPSSRRTYSCVGTALYAAPEILHRKNYDKGIDWWSVGVIFFEMLVGYAPFCAKDTNEVMNKIMNFNKYYKIPPKVKLSPQATDLLKRFITEPENRIGNKGVDEIKNHPFFTGINWQKIRETKPPFIPKLKHEADSHYFETFIELDPFYPPLSNKKRKDAEYLGYTYKGDDCVQTDLIKAIEIIENVKLNASIANPPNNEHNNSSNTKSIDKQDNINVINSKFDISKENLSKNDINITSTNSQVIDDSEMNGLPSLRELNQEEHNKTKLQIITLPKQLKLENIEHNKSPPMTSRHPSVKSDKDSSNKGSNGNCEANSNTSQHKSNKNIFFNGLMSMKKSLSFKLKRNKSKSPEKDNKSK